MANKLLPICADGYSDFCRTFIKKLVDFGVQSCSLPETRNPNRVELKKAILNTTRGLSLTKFVTFLGLGEKQHLKAMMLMECPVICPNRKVMLPPVESMPSNVMKSAKRLRNFFGIPEAQICRGCIKRVRCRRYQQIERDVPDLSDLASVLIGVYSICKINLQGSDLVVAESSLKELPSIISVLDSLSEYCKAFPQMTEYPRGDEAKCRAALQKHMKMKEMKKMEMLKQKAFNLPENFSALPARNTYMASFQREIYDKLQKGATKKKEDEELWVADTGDTTLDDDNSDEMVNGLRKLNKARLAQPNGPIKSENVDADQIHELEPGSVQFRMEYSTPIGGDVNLVRYDIISGNHIQGIKVNTKGRVVIDLEKHVSEVSKIGSQTAQGIEMYRPVSPHKMTMYAEFLKDIPSHEKALSFLKRVSYNYQCQSSGEFCKNTEISLQEDVEAFQNLAMALASQTNEV